MPRTSESFDKDLAILASTTTSALHDSVKPFRKAGALAANDFAGQAEVGDAAVNTTNGVWYTCTATNGTTTATWALI